VRACSRWCRTIAASRTPRCARSRTPARRYPALLSRARHRRIEATGTGPGSVWTCRKAAVRPPFLSPLSDGRVPLDRELRLSGLCVQLSRPAVSGASAGWYSGCLRLVQEAIWLPQEGQLKQPVSRLSEISSVRSKVAPQSQLTSMAFMSSRIRLSPPGSMHNRAGRRRAVLGSHARDRPALSRFDLLEPRRTCGRWLSSCAATAGFGWVAELSDELS
jgi:hypothetical protein